MKKWIGSPEVILTDISSSFFISNRLSFKPRFVNSVMIFYSYLPKIFRSIIEFISIYVVSSFAFTKGSSQFFFKNNNVNKLTSIPMSRVISKISPRGDTSSSFPIKMSISFWLVFKNYSITIRASFSQFSRNLVATISAFIFNHKYIIPQVRTTI